MEFILSAGVPKVISDAWFPKCIWSRHEDIYN